MLVKHAWRRRAILAGGIIAVVAWVKGAPLLLSLGNDAPDYRPLAGLEPFRELVTGGTSSSVTAAFAGLPGDDEASPDLVRAMQDVRDNPCRAFFSATPPGPVPVAVFSDFRCPNCRVMDARLAEIELETPGAFRIVRHELPIFGAASVTAARAVLAAALQDAYAPMFARLIRTPVITDRAYVARLANDLGLDAPRLVSDMDSPQVDDRLTQSKAIAKVFGFIGTPAFAVGHTVFLGAIPKRRFMDLLSDEKGFTCPDA